MVDSYISKKEENTKETTVDYKEMTDDKVDVWLGMPNEDEDENDKEEFNLTATEAIDEELDLLKNGQQIHLKTLVNRTYDKHSYLSKRNIRATINRHSPEKWFYNRNTKRVSRKPPPLVLDDITEEVQRKENEDYKRKFSDKIRCFGNEAMEDYLTGGLPRRTLSIWGAESNSGKTHQAAHFIAAALRNGHTACLISTETDRAEHRANISAAYGSTEEVERLEREKKLSIPQLNDILDPKQVQEALQEYQFDLLCIDYLKKGLIQIAMDTNPSVLQEAMREFHSLAKHLNMAILLFAQKDPKSKEFKLDGIGEGKHRHTPELILDHYSSRRIGETWQWFNEVRIEKCKKYNFSRSPDILPSHSEGEVFEYNICGKTMNISEFKNYLFKIETDKENDNE